MERTELITWIESHNVPDHLRVYVHHMKNTRSYEALEGLVDDNVATVKITLLPHGITLEAVSENLEEELGTAQTELDAAKETIKTQEKEIANLKETLAEAEVKPVETTPKKKRKTIPLSS